MWSSAAHIRRTHASIFNHLFLFLQVHEKTILLVALPVLLYFPRDPLPCFWFLQLATFSMMPLIKRDGLLLAGVALTILYLVLFRVFVRWTIPREEVLRIPPTDFIGMSGICKTNESYVLMANCLYNDFITLFMVAQHFIPPPKQFPHLVELLIAVYCCLQFVMFYLYFTFRQVYGYDFSSTPVFPTKRSAKKAKLALRRNRSKK